MFDLTWGHWFFIFWICFFIYLSYDLIVGNSGNTTKSKSKSRSSSRGYDDWFGGGSGGDGGSCGGGD